MDYRKWMCLLTLFIKTLQKKKKTTINANIVDRCKSMPADWGG